MAHRAELVIDLKKPIEFLKAVAERRSFFVPTRSERELHEFVALKVKVRQSAKDITIPAKVVGRRPASSGEGANKLSAGVFVLVTDTHDEGVLLLEGVCGAGIIDLQQRADIVRNVPTAAHFDDHALLESELLNLRNGEAALLPGEAQAHRGDRYRTLVTLNGHESSLMLEVELRGFSRRDNIRSNRVVLRNASARKEIDLFLTSLKISRALKTQSN